MMKHKHLLSVFIALLFSVKLAYSEQEKFKAIFIYQFTKYIEWPKQSNSNQFVIAVYKDSKLLNELLPLSNKRMVGNRTIVVKTISSVAGAKNAQIVFIPKSEKKSLELFSQELHNDNVLIIANVKAACKKGADINFISNSAGLSFEINSSNISSSGLKMNNTLLTLGKEVLND